MVLSPQSKRLEWLAAERGYVHPGKGKIVLRVALLYPNSYHIAMSSLGFQIAYRTLNDHPGVVAERFFMDSMDGGSIESGTHLADFDAIAISASFELDEPNILAVLQQAGLPLEARERTGGARRMPLVLMGGVLVSVNRYPLFPFVDAFLHGDAEVVLPPLLDALCEVADAHSSAAHRDRLEAIADLPGVEVTPGAMLAAGMEIAMDGGGDGRGDLEALATIPSERSHPDELPRPDAPAAPRLDNLENDLCATQILTPHCEFSDMALIDLARGCPHHCTFCWIGHNSPPYRARSLDTIFSAMEHWIPHTNRFGLVSSAVGAHPEIDEICRWATKKGLAISYSSLRVEEVTPTMLETLVKGGQRSITVAPEAGNPRLRRLLGKNITDEQILEVVDRLLSLGGENIKLYFMMGVPSETEEEAMDIARFSEKVRQVMLRRGRGRGKMGYLGLNLGVFVPKPNLPLNRIEPLELAVVKKRLKKVVKELQRIPNTRLNVSSPDLALAQSVLSMGGVEASRYLQIVMRGGGDWRAANRAWKKQTGFQFEAQKRSSHIAKETVQARRAGPIAR